MELYHAFNEWFWKEERWLMPGVTWEDMTPTPQNGYPNAKDLFPCALGFALLFLVLRYFLIEPFFFKILGRVIGLKEQNNRQPVPNSELECLYHSKKKGKLNQVQVIKVSHKLGWTERQVERWIRLRKASDKPSTMFKFCDSAWQLMYYVSYFVYGVIVLYDKNWFWNINLCWSNYPFQAMTPDIWWYYMIPLGYYTYMSLTFMVQPLRKDAVQMFLHHIVTLALIWLSFVVNMVRTGSLILFVHEVADIPLQLGKICGYAKYHSLMDFFFVLFVLTWVSTRLFLFPFWIMKNTIFEAHLILDTMYDIYYIFNGLLCVLLVFHICWTFLILKIVVNKLKTKYVKDVRSDSEDSLDELDSKGTKKEE